MTRRQLFLVRVALVVVAVAMLVAAVLIARAGGAPVLPAPTGAAVETTTAGAVPLALPAVTPPTVCTPAGACILVESTPFTVVR